MVRNKLNKLVVIGVGLIGGSAALALKRARAVKRIVGVGRSRANLATALRAGLIDEVAYDAGDAVRDADLVLLATPVAQMAPLMAQLAPRLAAHTVITDAGSTKQDVIACARKFLGARFSCFVPAHPIAGSETSGAAAARADLYRGRTVILTPQPETDLRAMRLVRALWRTCGARLVNLSAQEHDAVFAAVSHLPHLLAFAMMDEIASRPNGGALLRYGGSGFRDFTRIAGSSPEMWRDICIANRDALLAELDAFESQLERLHALIEQGDAQALEEIFTRACAARRRWLEGK
ncbi:MAG: prephenate dehydrogenase/arogenate dehydrogenase family protein [Betaproteobacteria bacterium]|nr:prephenate dehydrogenase/arogenate dehydrogenase family protein [Betaproteobacteria bacterium]